MIHINVLGIAQRSKGVKHPLRRTACTTLVFCMCSNIEYSHVDIDITN